MQITSFMARKLDCPPTQPFPCVMLAFAAMLCSCPKQLGEIHLHPGIWPTMAYNPSCVGGFTTQSPSDLGWVGTRSMKHDLDLNPKMATYLHVPPYHPKTCYVSNLLLRMAQSVEERKRLTFMIQTKHKQELQTWKTSKINELLSRKSSWKLLPHMQKATHQRVAGHPLANEFADMLEQLFAGDPSGELQPPQLTEMLGRRVMCTMQ